MKAWEITIQYDAIIEDHVILLPNEMLEEFNWKTDDIIVYSRNDKGKITVKKKDV